MCGAITNLPILDLNARDIRQNPQPTRPAVRSASFPGAPRAGSVAIAARGMRTDHRAKEWNFVWFVALRECGGPQIAGVWA